MTQTVTTTDGAERARDRRRARIVSERRRRRHRDLLRAASVTASLAAIAAAR